MNLQEIIVKHERELAPQHHSDDESSISLTHFNADAISDSHLKELTIQLVGLTSPGQVAAVLSLYLPQFDWGGTEA